MKVIREEIMPILAKELEDKKINMEATIFFFAGAINNMLKEIDNKDLKEVIIRYMFD